MNPTANPQSAALGPVSWVRFVLKTVLDGKLITLDQAFTIYDPIVRNLTANGTKVLMVINQETYGGGWPWSTGNWPDYLLGYAQTCSKIAVHYKGQVAAYELGNEMDVTGQPTSAPIAADVYGVLLVAACKAIRAADPKATIVSGGLASDNPIGYMQAVKKAAGVPLPVDAIGYHPYGKTPPNTDVFGWQPNTLNPAIRSLYSAFGLQIWITELGVARVDVNNQALWSVIGDYMRNTFALIRGMTNICPILIWFAWADSQDNAGIVHDDQTHKGDVWAAFAWCVANDNPNPKPPPVVVDPPTTPAAKSPNSLIGGYIMQGGEWFLQDMKTLSDEGKPISAVMHFRLGWGSECTPDQTRQVSPKTLTFERWYWSPNVDWTQPDLYAVGAELMIDYYNTFPVSHIANFIYLVNEPMPGPGTASFWMGAMAEAERRGLHLSVGNWPETWPALPDENDSNGQPKYFRQFWTLPEVHNMIAQIILGGHCLSWHEYIIPDPGGPWNEGWSMGRADKIVALLPEALRNVMIVLTEWGTGMSQGMGDGQIVDGFNAGDVFAHALKANLQGLIAWCIGPWTDNAHPKINSDLGYHRSALLARWQGAKF